MTDQAKPPAGSERPIQFHGREIWVRFPSGEALVVWKRTLAMLQRGESEWNGQQVMAAFERTRKIIDSVIVNQPDKEWLDELWLDGELDIVATAEIINLTVAAFAAGDNRATKRAAVKKATRRAPAKYTIPTT